MTEKQDAKDDSLDEIADLPSQNEMRRELIAAIEEALKEREALKKTNQDLQRQIIMMDPHTDNQQNQPV
jgi:hypothetical protein